MRCLQVFRMALVFTALTALFQFPTQAQAKERPVKHPTFYRTIHIGGLSIFYREVGQKDAPTLLLGANTICRLTFWSRKPIAGM